MIIKIEAYDGKEFKGLDVDKLINECNAYEADLRLKKQKEEAERKARIEKEEKIKAYRESKLVEINNDLMKLTEKIKEYEKETGYKIIFGVDYTNGKTVVKDMKNTLDNAWDNFFEDLYKIFGK